ncbi:MAG: hypothetical protein ABI380_07870 [Edaphobacter sp.]
MWYVARNWNSINAQMSGIGWEILIAGVVVAVFVGAGLSALVIYSSRID